MSRGITSDEAAKRLQQFGFNELPSVKPKNVARIALEVMKEPMFLLLIGCGTLYMLVGDYREGIVLLSTILLIISITFYQYNKTERALEALKQLTSPRALVIRDGQEKRIPGREVVPGDILILNEGDRIPTDAEVVETMNFQVDESLLTGEAMPVAKYSGKGRNTLYSGTLVVQGRCIAEATRTGSRSRLGTIATSINSINASQTRLQQEMKVLIKKFAITGIVISLSVIVIFYLTRGNIIKSVLLGLASAMAILPEEFPVVLTVFLALGAWRLSKKNVLTRKPSAIETLGAATVLCSDKTGTITQNKMEVAALATHEGYFAASLLSSTAPSTYELIRAGQLASSSATIDPMDNAINQLAARLSINPGVTKLIREYPLSSELLVVTRIYQLPDGKAMAATKGAPEAIFRLCKLNSDEILLQQKLLKQMAGAGFRILGAASSQINRDALPATPSEIEFKFLGLIAFEDPIRPEVPQAIKDCHSAGVNVIMITGDHPLTAASISHKAGLVSDKVITGEELSQMTDQQLKECIKNTTVFARIVPEHKLRIVRALKENGEVVAMTGDGVNDAPALKAADIGIAMGLKGTDVAREAASLVILDDNFASIVSAIRLGRQIFDNMQKAMAYIVSIHIPIIGLTLLPALFPTLPLLLFPLHIVFMELIIDPVCSVAFESEQEEVGIMNRPPRSAGKKFFGNKTMAFSFFRGILLLASVLVVYFISLKEGHSEKDTRVIAFSSLVAGNIFMILTSLSGSRSFISIFKEKNVAAISIVIVATAVLLAAISIPQLRQLFSFGNPGYAHFIPSALGSSALLFILEGMKYIKIRQRRKPVVPDVLQSIQNTE